MRRAPEQGSSGNRWAHLIRILPLLLALTVSLSCRRDSPFPIRVACVGDSITEGSRLAWAGRKTYPQVLEAMSGGQWEVRNFGVGGATLLQRGDRPYQNESAYVQALAFRPHFVIILLGANDSKPHNWAHGRDFAQDYRTMIRAFQGLETRPQVWICCPVPAFSHRYAHYNDVIRDEIRNLVKEVGREEGVSVIDLYAEMEDRERLFPDQIHPNAEGARCIAEAIC